MQAQSEGGHGQTQRLSLQGLWCPQHQVQLLLARKAHVTGHPLQRHALESQGQGGPRYAHDVHDSRAGPHDAKGLVRRKRPAGRRRHGEG